MNSFTFACRQLHITAVSHIRDQVRFCDVFFSLLWYTEDYCTFEGQLLAVRACNFRAEHQRMSSAANKAVLSAS